MVNAKQFWNAQWKEPFDAYLTKLRTVAALYDDDVKRMIRDKIVFSASGKLQELLLRLMMSCNHLCVYMYNKLCGETHKGYLF